MCDTTRAHRQPRSYVVCVVSGKLRQVLINNNKFHSLVIMRTHLRTIVDFSRNKSWHSTIM
jgi:hypothetical protein